MEAIKEDQVAAQAEREADRYFKKYREHVELLESKSILSQVRSITPFDVYSLGKQLESFESYREMCEEDGTLAQLGRIPNIALDVITVSYGTSPLNVIATNQPIEEERGIVYFKDLIAQDTRGNVTAGDTLMSADSAAPTHPQGYSGDLITETLGNTAAATQSYAFTLAEFPIRTQKVTVSIPTKGLKAYDDGNGILNGNGIFGTVNYQTGALTVELAADPLTAESILVEYSTDFESAVDIPKVIFKMRTKPVLARIWALKDTSGIFQSFALRKRFGLVADDIMAEDLISALNMEQMNTAIGILSANVQGNVNYSKASPTGVSNFEHKQSFKNSIADAEANMLGNAGRGTVSIMVAGRNACALMQTLPGFKRIGDGSNIGPHIFGTLDGVVIIRIPSSAILSADVVICLYKGNSPFEAALAVCPYMPLVVTSAMPTGANPLTSQKAAAVWSAIEPLVPNFITKITLVP